MIIGMGGAPTEIPSWTRSPWVKWSWLVVLVVIVAQSLNYHWRVLPTSAAGYFARGKGDYLNGEFPSAVANFTKSIDLRPNDADTYLWRGETYVMIHDLARAMTDLEKAVELRPDYERARSALGDGKSAAWDAAGAIAEYSLAIVADPNCPRCYLVRGRRFVTPSGGTTPRQICALPDACCAMTSNPPRTRSSGLPLRVAGMRPGPC
jgi:tetratricopeptide (TPR) repeat protein